MKRGKGSQATSGDLAKLATGFMTTAALSVAVRLGIADLLSGGPRDAEEIARATHCHVASLARLLRGLSAMGIVTEDLCDRFTLTPLGEQLRADHPASLAPLLVAVAQPHVQAAWLELAHVVRTGRSAFYYAHGSEYWTYLGRHPDLAASLLESLGPPTPAEYAAIVSSYDFSSIATLVDVGGGRGELLASILRRNPQMSGILFDQPSCGPAATDFLRAQRVADRAKFVGGDFFSEVPSGADVYLLADVIADWSDADAVRILRTCRSAMGSGSRLLLVQPAAPHACRMADLHRMVLFGDARQRTNEELGILLETAGFRSSPVASAGLEAVILEGIPIPVQHTLAKDPPL